MLHGGPLGSGGHGGGGLHSRLPSGPHRGGADPAPGRAGARAGAVPGPGGIITVGEEDTVVTAGELPEGLSPGDDVRVTGTVEKTDVLTTDDFDALQEVTDQETAQYLVDRGEERVLTDAPVTVVE
ncbi:hypothetical protein ACH9EU_04990 [Kocuria sp. M1R5S2]